VVVAYGFSVTLILNGLSDTSNGVKQQGLCGSEYSTEHPQRINFKFIVKIFIPSSEPDCYPAEYEVINLTDSAPKCK
jgi:hypothetical protein